MRGEGTVAVTGGTSALLARGCDFLHILKYSTRAQSTSDTKHAAAIPPMRPAFCFKESERMGGTGRVLEAVEVIA